MDKSAALEQPKVYTNQDSHTGLKKPWYQSWRIIYPILGLVVMVELIFGLKALFAPLPKTSSAKLSPISGAKIFLTSSKEDFKVGEKIPVTVKISTGGHPSFGTDLILRFDPKILQATAADFKRGEIYPDYPLISFDTTKGVIRISAVSTNRNQSFNGIGELGMINFTATSLGQDSLTVDFTKGSTDDSNVIDTETNSDVLDKVYNLNILIK